MAEEKPCGGSGSRSASPEAVRSPVWAQRRNQEPEEEKETRAEEWPGHVTYLENQCKDLDICFIILGSATQKSLSSVLEFRVGHGISSRGMTNVICILQNGTVRHAERRR